MYKTPGPWRTPKWVWPYRIERQPVGPRREALLMVYRELGRDRYDTAPAGSKMLVRSHNGIPLRRGHLLGSLKAPKARQRRRNAPWRAKLRRSAGHRQRVSSYGFLGILRGALSRKGGKGGKRRFPPVLLAACQCDVGPLGVSGGGMK